MENVRSDTQSLLAPALGALLGFLTVAGTLGLSLVDPTEYEWLLHGDWNLHFLGWHLYRRGPWTFPIGATPLLAWPVGSSVGLTDSIPLAAILFKPFSPFLPDTFQFIGLWFLLCFMLHGVFAVLLMRLATSQPSLHILGAGLLMLSPMLFFRIGHPALMAHWLILASLWLYFKDSATAPDRRRLVAWASVVGLGAAIQPYLWLMVVALMVAAHARVALAMPSKALHVAAHVALTLAWSVIVLWQSGDFIVSRAAGLEVAGVGAWSMNLLSLMTPAQGSTLFGPGPFTYATPGQYEGYAYLGAGMLLLAAVALVTLLTSRPSSGWLPRAILHLPLLLAFLFLTLLALGPAVTVGSRTLFEYSSEWWGPLRVFRSSGRMFWPVYYALVFGILTSVSRLRHSLAALLFVIALALQAADVSGSMLVLREARTFGFRNPLQSRFWQRVPRRYQRLVLIPSNLCTRDDFVQYTPFSLLAGRMGLAINAGITARYDVKKAATYCERLGSEVEAGSIDADALYVVQPYLVDRLKAAAGPHVMCAPVDGYGICVAPETYRGWQDLYDVLAAALPPPTELVSFLALLDGEYRTGLGRPPQISPAPAEERVGAMVRYLSYRLGGCAHGEAREKTLNEARGSAEFRYCANDSFTRALPPADDAYAVRVALESVYRERALRADITTWVDVEGEAVWLLAYAEHRRRGLNAVDASEHVLAAVRAAAR